jgi:hypothetical protein
MRLIEGAQALAVATPQDVMVISNASSVLAIGLHEASYLLAGEELARVICCTA